MGSPSIYVYDCSNAGTIVQSFKQFSVQREHEAEVSKTLFADTDVFRMEHFIHSQGMCYIFGFGFSVPALLPFAGCCGFFYLI